MDLEQFSDIQIVQMAVQDQEYFRELYLRYSKKIYQFVRYRISSEEDAQDVTSEVFIKTLSNIDRYDQQHAFSTWIYQIARNSVIDYWRRTKLVVDLDKVEQQVVEIENFDDVIDAKMRIEYIMSHLSPAERTLLTLRYVEDLSFAEISEITGRSEGALRTAFHRLKKAISNI